MSELGLSDSSRLLVLEPGRAERHYWGLMGISRISCDPGVARCRRALQADRDRHRLGGGAAVPDDGRVHDRVSPVLYSLNPMVGVIDGFRWCVLGGGRALYLPGFTLSLLIVTLMLWLGVAYFRNTEHGFADPL